MRRPRFTPQEYYLINSWYSFLLEAALINISGSVESELDRSLFNDAVPTGKVPIECDSDHQCRVHHNSERCEKETLEISPPVLTFAY
jgi:hypothetical protein